MPPEITAKEIIEFLNLESHPEGGFFKETYRATGMIENKRNYSTAIYFLLPEGTKSKLHRIASDELWHFYLGGPLTIVQISPKGEVLETTLGPDFKKDQRPQHIVPAGHWFGAYPSAGIPFSLVGCTVAPGFDFADFEMGDRTQLLKQFPGAKEAIEKLTP